MIERHQSQARILFVEDDPYFANLYASELRDEGYEVIEASNVDSALFLARSCDFEVVILDVMLDPGKFFNIIETQGGHKTGIALARELRDRMPDAKILALTNSLDADVEEWFTTDELFAFARKSTVGPQKLVRLVKDLIEERKSPRVFVVHGRDSDALCELKAFLSRIMPDTVPIILAEQPSRGKTLIEKFEHYAGDVDLVFVLATADDIGRIARPRSQGKPRARQNVVFELGFFHGALKRTAGHVILLYERGVELPSDIEGVVYVDISNGIRSAEDAIRRELREWID